MTEQKHTLLVIDKDVKFLDEVKLRLGKDFLVETSQTGVAGLKQFRAVAPKVVLVENDLTDMSFTDLLLQMRGIDKNVIRLITAVDFSRIESVIDAINEAHAHKYFRKPINFGDLTRAINDLIVDYHVVTGYKQGSAAASATYKKLNTILDKVKKAEAVQKDAEVQLAKAGSIEAEAVKKIEEARATTNKFKNQAKELEQVIKELENRIAEGEQTRQKKDEEIRKLQDDFEAQAKKYEDINDAIKEMEINMTATQDAALTVSEDFKKPRNKKNGKDTILFVDDEPDIRNTVNNLYGDQFNIHLADGHVQAMKILAEDPDIALVLSDYRMPEVNGGELGAKIRALYPDLPVYLVTAYADLQEAIQAMSNGFIQKYFKKDMLVEADSFPKEIEAGIAAFDTAASNREIITEKKTFVVDRIKSLTGEMKKLQYENGKLADQGQKTTAKLQATATDLEKSKKENSVLRVSVAAERKKMLEDMQAERAKFEDQLAARKAEAQKELDQQKQKNEQTLKDMQAAMDAEKKKGADELKRIESEKQALIEKANQEKAEIANMEKEMQKKLAAEREAAQKEMDQKKQEMMAVIAKERENMGKEIDRMKAEAQKEFETQKTKNQEAVKAMQKALEDEQKKREQEIKKIEAEKQAALDKIAKEKEAIKKEEADMKQKLAAAQKASQAELEKQKKEAAAEVQKVKDGMEAKKKDMAAQLEEELAKRRKEAESEIEELKKSATAELDKTKKVLATKETELTEALKTNKNLQQENASTAKERDKAVKEISDMKSQYEFAINSRAALEAEIAALKG